MLKIQTNLGKASTFSFLWVRPYHCPCFYCMVHWVWASYDIQGLGQIDTSLDNMYLLSTHIYGLGRITGDIIIFNGSNSLSWPRPINTYKRILKPELKQCYVDCDQTSNLIVHIANWWSLWCGHILDACL